MLLVVIAVSASAVIYSIVTSSIAPTNSRSTSTSFTIDDVTSTPYQISVCARNTGMAPTYIARVYVEGEGGVLVIDETEIPDAPAQPGHKFPITFPNNLVSGDYLFTLATSSGNVTEATFYVNGGSQGNGSTPTRPIIVTVLLPANTTYTNASASYLLPINVAVSSPSPVTAIAQLDGTANITLTPSGGYYTGTATVSSGTHTIRIYATDSVGNVNSSQSVTFTCTLDHTAPTVIINSPITNEDCYISDIVSVTASDPSGISYVIANVNGQNYTMTLQNGFYVLPFSQIAGDLDSSYYIFWLIQIRVPNVITIYATDSVGNVNSSQSVTFYYWKS